MTTFCDHVFEDWFIVTIVISVQNTLFFQDLTNLVKYIYNIGAIVGILGVLYLSFSEILEEKILKTTIIPPK